MYECTSVIIGDLRLFLKKTQQELYKSLHYVHYSLKKLIFDHITIVEEKNISD